MTDGVLRGLWTQLLNIDEPVYFVVLTGGLIPLVGAFFLLRRQPLAVLLAFQDEKGTVYIRRKALEALIQETCRAIDAVGAARTRLYRQHGKLDLEVHLKLWRHCRVSEIREALQEALADNLEKNLGFADLGAVNIVIDAARPSETSLRRVQSSHGGQSGDNVGHSYKGAGSEVRIASKRASHEN
jgi:hypothetical protein